MSTLKMTCDAECGQQFTITEMSTVQFDGGIEKTYFTCPHCQREYVAFYTDDEIRKLQKRIRKVQRRLTDPNDNHADVRMKEAKLQEQIKEKMDALRKRVEGGAT